MPEQNGPVKATPSSARRGLSLDEARGLACFLLVAYHVIGATPASGLRLEGDSPWHYVTESFAFIRMPIFSFLSGYLYAGNRVSAAGLRHFLPKKAKRILLPLLCGTLVYWAFRQMFLNGEDVSLLQAYLTPYLHFWFLQSIFLIFTAVAVIDSRYHFGPAVMGAAIVGFAILNAAYQVPEWVFGAGGALYLAPYFLAGMLVRTSPAAFARPATVTIMGAIAITILLVQQAGMLELLPRLTRKSLLAVLCGIAAAIVLVHVLPRLRPLAVIGTYSFTIYIWHVLFTASCRIVMIKLGPVSTPVLFACCLIAGIFGPILVHKLVSPLPLFSELLLGTPRGRGRGRTANAAQAAS